MTPAKAYHVASQYGSYINGMDPGRCFYSFFLNDARPGSEAHRKDCIAYAEEQLSRTVTGVAMGELVCGMDEEEGARAISDLEGLVAFFKTTELHPLALADEAA